MYTLKKRKLLILSSIIALSSSSSLADWHFAVDKLRQRVANNRYVTQINDIVYNMEHGGDIFLGVRNMSGVALDAAAHLSEIGFDTFNAFVQFNLDLIAYNNKSNDYFVSAGEEINGYSIFLKGAIKGYKHRSHEKYVSSNYDTLMHEYKLGLSKNFDAGKISFFYQYTLGDTKRYNSEKSKSISYTLGFSGYHHITDCLYLSGSGAYLNTEVEEELFTKKRKNGYEILTKLGYKYNISDDIFITPKLGVKYFSVHAAGFKDENNLISVNASNFSKTDVVAGILLSKKFNIYDNKITAQLSSNVIKTISDRGDDLSFTFTPLSEEFVIQRHLTKDAHIDLGLKLIASNSKYDISTSYTFSCSERDVNHIGSLGVKILF